MPTATANPCLCTTDAKPFVHLWFDPSFRWRSFKPGTLSCRFCGLCKPDDPARQTSGCRGRVRLTLRGVTPEFRRAHGDTLCSCGKAYWTHPFTRDRSYDHQPFLRQLCDGSTVKL